MILAFFLILPFDISVREHCKEEYVASAEGIHKELICTSTANDWISNDVY